mgnify:CR=1 FL=1
MTADAAGDASRARKLAVLSRVAGWVHRLFQASYRLRNLDRSYAQVRGTAAQPRCLYAFWHENLWHGAHSLRDQGVCVMVSTHRDGELIARILARQGFRLARGSSTRGGARALRDFVRVAKDETADLCVTVDGPKGPRREVKEGILFASAMTGLPIVPTGVAVASSWRTNSWDRLQIGKPFSRVAFALGPEVRVPRGTPRDELVQWGQRLRESMDAAEQRARAVLEGAADPGPASDAQARGAAQPLG